jgi:hypothetical protein
LVRKLEGRRPLGRPRHKWEDNIRRDLTEIGWEGVDWIHLVQDRRSGRLLSWCTSTHHLHVAFKILKLCR